MRPKMNTSPPPSIDAFNPQTAAGLCPMSLLVLLTCQTHTASCCAHAPNLGHGIPSVQHHGAYWHVSCVRALRIDRLVRYKGCSFSLSRCFSDWVGLGRARECAMHEYKNCVKTTKNESTMCSEHNSIGNWPKHSNELDFNLNSIVVYGCGRLIGIRSWVFRMVWIMGCELMSIVSSLTYAN